MNNAHERFGFAEFEKKLRDTTTRIRLTADCFISERAGNSAPSVGHLLSAFGTDVEVAALWAAILGEESIRVGGPDLKPYMVQFGERPAVYCGTLTVPGRRRPIRHLVVVSTQLRAEGDQARIIAKSNSPDLILRAVTEGSSERLVCKIRLSLGKNWWKRDSGEANTGARARLHNSTPLSKVFIS
jgi:hypothetical protein